MKAFVLSEEDFHLGILDSVPIPGDNESILLYRSEDREKKSAVISKSATIQSAKVRHEKYNKKVVLSLFPKQITLKQRIVMVENEFCFEMTVKVDYVPRDIKKYFFEEDDEAEQIVGQIIKRVTKNCNGQWDLKKGVELESYLEEKLSKQFALCESLKIRILDLEVRPDQDAQAILAAERKKTVDTYTYKYQTDEKVAQHGQDIRFIESENELYKKKIERMGMLMQNFGSLGPIVESYLKGQKNGEDLYQYIMENRTSELKQLSIAFENNLLSQEDAFEKVRKLLSDQKNIQGEKAKQLIEDKKEEKEQEGEQGNYSLSDDDYI